MCYQKIYGEEELEPGEIDTRRSRMFTACLTTEERENRRQQVRERYYGNKQPSASTTQSPSSGNKQPSASTTQSPSRIAEMAPAAEARGGAVVDEAVVDDDDDPGDGDELQLAAEEETETPMGVAEEL
jgi:hypothetical protein